MRYLLVSAAAVMAITGAATYANAQAPDMDKGKGPSAESQGPGSGAQRGPAGNERAPSANRPEQKSEGSKGAQKRDGDQPKAKTTQRPDADQRQPKAAGQADKNTNQRKAEQRESGKDQRKAEQREPGKDQRKSAEERKSGKDKTTAEQKEPGKDRSKSANDGRPDAGKNAAERKQPGTDRSKFAETPDRKQDRVKVSEQQRTSVRQRLITDRSVERVRRTNINVSINVGAQVPRSVRLHTLPVAIVSLAPAYRSYSYFVLEDETICIVDPRTYVIVDVIPAGTQRAHLTLSNEDMRFIYRSVPRDRTANVRIRLALGAEVPRDVELLDFPEEVVARVPDVRRYRYIVTDGEVVIVDPNDYDVALVINE